jgi:hypothetical protein
VIDGREAESLEKQTATVFTSLLAPKDNDSLTAMTAGLVTLRVRHGWPLCCLRAVSTTSALTRISRVSPTRILSRLIASAMLRSPPVGLSPLEGFTVPVLCAGGPVGTQRAHPCGAG